MDSKAGNGDDKMDDDAAAAASKAVSLSNEMLDTLAAEDALAGPALATVLINTEFKKVDTILGEFFRRCKPALCMKPHMEESAKDVYVLFKSLFVASSLLDSEEPAKQRQMVQQLKRCFNWLCHRSRRSLGEN